MAPTCLEYQKPAYIASWDFDNPIYLNTVYDRGSGGYNFVLLDNQLSYDPIYVDNQGFYFDSTSQIRSPTTKKWTQSNQYSITIEAWIRPMDVLGNGHLFVFESKPGTLDSEITFSGNNVVVTLQTTSVTIPITAPTVGEWYYIGVSIERISLTRSRI